MPEPGSCSGSKHRCRDLVVDSLDTQSEVGGFKLPTSVGKTLIKICHSPHRCKLVPCNGYGQNNCMSPRKNSNGAYEASLSKQNYYEISAFALQKH